VRVEQPAPGQTVNNSSSESRTTLVPANSLVTSTEAISLHGDPAFQQLLAKIGLPPVSFTSKKNQSEDLSLRAPESSGYRRMPQMGALFALTN
jgi:hypothetical protein